VLVLASAALSLGALLYFMKARRKVTTACLPAAVSDIHSYVH
jgi:hypothetical protein